jgi:hypothetical protein
VIDDKAFDNLADRAHAVVKEEADRLLAAYGVTPTLQRSSLVVLAFLMNDAEIATIWKAINQYLHDPANHDPNCPQKHKGRSDDPKKAT